MQHDLQARRRPDTPGDLDGGLDPDSSVQSQQTRRERKKCARFASRRVNFRASGKGNVTIERVCEERVEEIDAHTLVSTPSRSMTSASVKMDPFDRRHCPASDDELVKVSPGKSRRWAEASGRLVDAELSFLRS